MLCWSNICGTTPAFPFIRKTKVWNSSGVEPAGVSELQRHAEVATPGAIVWRGDTSLPTSEQGFKVLGGAIWDTQTSSSVSCSGKSMNTRCCSSGSRSSQTSKLRGSSCRIATSRGIMMGALTRSPCRRGRVLAPAPRWAWFLRSAQRIHPAAHWASWADALAMIQQRHPAIVGTIVGALKNNAESVSIRCLLDCVRKFAETGFEVPDWTDLAEGKVPGDEGEDDPCQPKTGWEKRVGELSRGAFLQRHCVAQLGDSECALALSQSGPLASVPFVCLPIDRTRRFDSQPFRLLLLHRFRQPQLPVWPSSRRPWPSPGSLRERGGFGAQGVGSRVSSGESMS